jgi:hypothetical protein
MIYTYIYSLFIKVLDKISQRILLAPAASKAAFESIDRRSSGSLDPPSVASYLRSLLPNELSPRDMHYLFNYLASLDVDGDASFSYHDLMVSLHAVTPVTLSSTVPRSHSQEGYRGRNDPLKYSPQSEPNRSAHHHRSDLDIFTDEVRRGSPQYSKQWSLVQHYDSAARRHFFLEPDGRLLYSEAQPIEWPLLEGRLVYGSIGGGPGRDDVSATSRLGGPGAGGRLELFNMAAEAVDLFSRLDDFLVSSRHRFEDLMYKYDSNSNGRLNTSDLKLLLKNEGIIPAATEAQLDLLLLVAGGEKQQHQQQQNLGSYLSTQDIGKGTRELLELFRQQQQQPGMNRHSSAAPAPDDTVGLLDNLSSFLYVNTNEAVDIWRDCCLAQLSSWGKEKEYVQGRKGEVASSLKSLNGGASAVRPWELNYQGLAAFYR